VIALPVRTPFDYLRYLLAQQVAATADRDRALRRGDAATAADSIVRANDTADILRVGFGLYS
jgi:hypothetical protein